VRILPLGNDKSRPDGVAIFYEVEDETLEAIKRNPEYYADLEFVQRCFKERGRNAHLYLLINDRDTREVIRNLRELMKEFKTVSWWTVEHKKFYIRGKI
jgi:hypothetical protein